MFPMMVNGASVDIYFKRANGGCVQYYAKAGAQATTGKVFDEATVIQFIKLCVLYEKVSPAVDRAMSTNKHYTAEMDSRAREIADRAAEVIANSAQEVTDRAANREFIIAQAGNDLLADLLIEKFAPYPKPYSVENEVLIKERSGRRVKAAVKALSLAGVLTPIILANTWNIEGMLEKSDVTRLLKEEPVKGKFIAKSVRDYSGDILRDVLAKRFADPLNDVISATNQTMREKAARAAVELAGGDPVAVDNHFITMATMKRAAESADRATATAQRRADEREMEDRKKADLRRQMDELKNSIAKRPRQK